MSDLERLLAPIPGHSPTGADLRLHPSDLTFQSIRKLREETPPEEDRDGVGSAADWRGVARACEEALVGKTKDLELAAWLAEAWAHLRGLGGVALGLELIASLCERYWPELHPGIDDGEIELPLRIRPLNWLGTRDFLWAVAACPLLTAGDRVLTWQHYLDSSLVDDKARLSNRTEYQQLIDRGRVGSEEWLSSLRGAPPGALAQTLEQALGCARALEDLRIRVGKLCGDEDAPSLIPLADLLSSMIEHLETRARGKEAPVDRESPHSEPEVSTPQAAPNGADTGLAIGAQGIQTRDEALRALAAAGQYFRTHEPYSPLSALVDRAVRWGGMSFQQLLCEVVEDKSALERAWTVLGIRPESGA